MSANTNTPQTQLGDWVYGKLRNSIVNGDFGPGAPLRQDVIANTYGVSKVPVREALLRLQFEGFVRFRTNRGAIVRQLSAREVLDLMDIRIALETKALELAIPRQSRTDLETARSILDHYNDHDRTESWNKNNRQFHHALYEPCENDELLSLIRDIQQRIGPVTSLIMTETSGITRPIKEHRKILAACEQADTDLALSLLRSHIETTKKETAAKLRKSSDKLLA